jgi:hypothetical protein
MALVVADTIEVRLNWSLSSQPWAQNVLHYLVPSGFELDATVAEEWAAEFVTAFSEAGSIANKIHPQYALNTVGFRDVRVANQPEFIDDVNSVGTGSGFPAPRQLCSVLTLRTALAGKSYRGRIYVGGWTAGSIGSSGGIDSAARTQLTQFGASLLSFTIGSSLVVLGVTSRLLNETTEVISVESRDDLWDWQRSRATIG